MEMEHRQQGFQFRISRKTDFSCRAGEKVFILMCRPWNLFLLRLFVKHTMKQTLSGLKKRFYNSDFCAMFLAIPLPFRAAV
jgi:hypothetical protein